MKHLVQEDGHFQAFVLHMKYFLLHLAINFAAYRNLTNVMLQQREVRLELHLK